MTENNKKIFVDGFFTWLQGLSRNLTAFTTVIGISYLLILPYVQPYLDKLNAIDTETIKMINENSEELQELTVQVERLNDILISIVDPQFIEFQQRPITLSSPKVRRGDTIKLTYSLRRKSPCRSSVQNLWFNLDEQVFVEGPSFTAIQDNVATQFNSFTTFIEVPDVVFPGRWVYWPILTPIACGDFVSPVRAPMSEIIEVIE